MSGSCGGCRGFLLLFLQCFSLSPSLERLALGIEVCNLVPHWVHGLAMLPGSKKHFEKQVAS